MAKLFAFYSAFILLILTGKVISRHLQYNVAELVSDGVSDGGVGRDDESVLHFIGTDSSEEQCELMYGFLPCSSNIPSHIFLIVIYEYLLYHGESYAGGDGRIFRVLGKNFFVSSASQLLDCLPDSLILLATGLSSSKEKAQEYAITGVGLLAGSSILLLTLLWGVCFICARKEFHVPGSKVVKNGDIKLLTGYGVVTDTETRFHANVMFFSLIPFVIILLPSVFGLSYSSQEYKIVLLVSLSASVICLILYFYYQHYDSTIRKRRLEYAEVEQKVEMHVPFYEVHELMLNRENNMTLKQLEMEKMLKNLKSSKKPMSKEDVYDVFKNWLDFTRKLTDDPYSLDETGKEYNQVVELLLEEKKKLIDLMLHMGGISHKEDGTVQDESAIDKFFKEIDTDNNGSISRIELKNFVMEAIHKEILVDDKTVEFIMRHLDIDRDENIDKDEFKSAVEKCFLQKESHDRNRKTDSCHRAEAKEKLKAIILLIVGIFMLTVLAEPLVESVRKFSESVKIEPFYVSFILVPLATNARTAIAAIGAANQKTYYTNSLTFSEIYHKVFLNNILGFSVLVSVIYFRGLTWHFSAEILVVVIVCIIMGLLASFRSKFPNWTLLIAFPLYPLSMVLVYFVNDAFQFT